MTQTLALHIPWYTPHHPQVCMTWHELRGAQSRHQYCGKLALDSTNYNYELIGLNYTLNKIKCTIVKDHIRNN